MSTQNPNLQNHTQPSMAGQGRVVILGAGESGVGAAKLAQQKGFDVFVSDYGSIAEKYQKALENLAIPFESGKHTESEILNAVEVIKSPGIPSTAPIVQQLLEKHIPVISEIEFAKRYTDARVICITGSNGKSTTSLLTYHILKKAGLNVGLAGNIGQSFAAQVASEAYDWYVLEISSFMLDDMFAFKADIAVLLNITPDHLDRYEYKMEHYAASKMRIVQNQSAADTFIYCADDPETLKALEGYMLPAKIYPFSILSKVDEGAYLANDTIYIHTAPNQELTMSISDLALQGKHNIYNSMASGIVAKVLELRNDTIRESMGDFKNIEHRLEHVAKISGIDFINDSKATNVNSTWYALESMTKPVILILGGVDKGNDYSQIEQLVRDKVKALIILSIKYEKLRDYFDDIVPQLYVTQDIQDAVNKAEEWSTAGDVVLLSPACASFDLFKNYEDRGDKFKTAVRNLVI